VQFFDSRYSASTPLFLGYITNIDAVMLENGVGTRATVSVSDADGCLQKTIIRNGKPIPFEEATVHALSVGLAYGASVFEGIRAYMNPSTRRLSVFRLEEHLVRLDQGMKFMRFDNPPTRAEMRQGVLDSILANAPDDDCYIRLQVQIETRGSMASTGPVGWVCAAIPRDESMKLTKPVVTGLPWYRTVPETIPADLPAGPQAPTDSTSADRLPAHSRRLQGTADGESRIVVLPAPPRYS
jgi:branched-chain amino acid aminotransferase